MIKLYAPKYYQQFQCIASRCRHSCCIGWEIDVDEETLARYQMVSEGYGKQILGSIDMEDTPHFRLATNERCPHLNEAGLCNIILSLGEGYLCEICREHPRFYHRTPHGMEVGLGMACEEACRIILSSDDYAQMIEVGVLDGEAETAAFDATEQRRRIYALLSDRSVPYAQRLAAIGEAFDLTLADLDDGEWRALLSSLEYLDKAHKSLFLRYSSDAVIPREWEEGLERALAYFIFRHGSQAEDAAAFRAALGLSLFCERLLSCVAWGVGDFAEAARIISEEIEYSEDNTRAICEMFITMNDTTIGGQQ